MTFRIRGLSPEPFRHLFGLPEAELRRHGARRCVADSKPGFPDRIGLSDAEPGESLLLVNYEHHPADNPYRARHAVYVREADAASYDRVGEVPEALRARLLSLRAFDADGMMVDADMIEGQGAEGAIERLLAGPQVAFLHAHFAKRGCFAARVEPA